MNRFILKPTGNLLSALKITEAIPNRKFNNQRLIITCLALFAFIFFTPKKVFSQCTSVPATFCEDVVNLSIDQNCQAVITATTLLTGTSGISQACLDSLKVALLDMNNNVITTGAVITVDASNGQFPEVGDQAMLQVFFDLNGNGIMEGTEEGCWSLWNVEDKLSPTITATCSDVTVFCFEDFSSTGSAVPQPIFTDNCSSVTTTITDEEIVYNCHDPNFSGPLDISNVISRKYKATDASGNMDSCTQVITVKRIPFDANNISSPVDVAVECNNALPLDTAAASTGYPTITFDSNDNPPVPITLELSPANLSGLCSNITVTYSDTPINITGCQNGLKEKFLREFTIIECCIGIVVTDVFQLIEIVDTTKPTITCPPDLTVSSTSGSCNGNVFLPPATTSDACSSVSVTVSTPNNGSLNSNGGPISNLALGTHVITYTATDECGNFETCTMNVTVEDLVLPTAVCDEHTIVGINNSFSAILFADVFDDGSYDNCGSVTFEARRMVDNCGIPANLNFRPFIEVCCADIGSVIMVEMRVTDAAGNTNSCMVEVEVQDKLDPTIICPADKTIACGSDYTDFGFTGQAIGFDNCGTATITNVDVVNIDPMCGEGTVERTWTATDGGGRTSSCVQMITITNSNPFTGDSNSSDDDDIEWPDDLTGTSTISCSAFLADPTLVNVANTGSPNVIGAETGCSNIFVGFDDLNLINNGAGKILRTWTVIDWCQYEPNNPTSDGIWTHTQIIKIEDTEAPILLNPPGDITANATANCMGTLIIPDINPNEISDCSSTFTITISGDLGSTSGSVEAGVGVYNIIYTVTDPAGNSTTHTITAEVEDNEPPVPVCMGYLTAPLMPGVNMLTIPAVELLSSSTTDNCATFEELTVTAVHAQVQTSMPPTETEVTFYCVHKGDNDIILWVCDPSGNCFSCVTTVNITDPNGSCPIALATADINGKIDDETGEGIEDVEVMINSGQQMHMTNANGEFEVPALATNQAYTFTPGKNTNPLNGVTTFDLVTIQRHILGNVLLDSPYKLIAADANGSGTITTFDMVAIRNLILLNTDEFPNGVPSWRFVDAAYEFPDPNNPFLPAFPEEYVIQNLATNMNDMDFVSVKIGDVNESAIPSLTSGSSDTRDAIGELKFTTQDAWLQKGETTTFRLSSDNLEDLEAWQFSLTYETQFLEILEVEKRNNVFVGSSLLENGVLTAIWSKDVNVLLEDKPTWLEIDVLAKEDIYLSDVIRLTSEYTKAEAYNVIGEIYDVSLHFDVADNSTLNKEDQFVLYQNVPNPFSDETIISFHLPEADNVTLKVYDISGKLINQVNQFFEKGSNQLTVSSKNLPITGMLYYRLETSKYHATQRMILLEK